MCSFFTLLFSLLWYFVLFLRKRKKMKLGDKEIGMIYEWKYAQVYCMKAV